MSKVIVSGSLIPSTTDTPIDKRERVKTFSEIANIENPCRFMTLVVEDTGKHYEVKKLSPKVISGLVVENATIDIDDPEALLDLDLPEEAREEAERKRKEAEILREETENIRKSNENARIQSENARKNAEQARKTEYNTLKNSLEGSIEEARQFYDRKADIDGQYDKLTAGNARNLIGRGVATSEEFNFRSSGEISIQDGTARVKKLKGNSVIFNQLVKNGSFSNGMSYWVTETGVTTTVENEECFVLKGNSDDKGIAQTILTKAGHIYKVSADVRSTSFMTMKIGITGTDEESFNLKANTQTHISFIIKQTGDKNVFYVHETTSIPVGFYIKNIQLSDLTHMFEAGNEPLTVDEFEALYPDSYYEYNSGEIKSLTATGIKSVGFNAWDEKWKLGYLSDYTGEETTDMKRVMSKNFIPCIGNTKYHATDQTGNRDIMIFFYDSSKRFLNHTPWYGNNTFTTPHNAAFMKFHCGASYGTTYKNDICINLSHTGYRNGEYEPYQEFVRELPIRKINDSDGNLLFPDGLCSIGSVYDEITEKKAIKRIGKRAYVAADAYDSTIMTDGTNTLYPLAKPIEVDLDPEVNMDYEVWDFGTEQMISDEFSTPIKADIVYGFNAVDRIRENTLDIQALYRMIVQLEDRLM